MDRFSCVLFDLDGTLVNTNGLIIEAFKYTIKKHLDLETDAEDFIPHFGEPLKDTFARYTKDSIEGMVKTFQEYDFTHHRDLVDFFPGVPETLAQLYQMGIHMGVITSKQEAAVKFCEHIGQLDEYFEVILTIDDIGMPKPSPEPLLKALEVMGCSGKEALMVGDSPADIRSAKNAGVFSSVVGWSMFPRDRLLAEDPDYWLNRFDDLIEICKSTSRT